ncbi:MAG TPA: hypothetical protein PKA21_02920 [Kiritimatiellia bacterium]|nr:hypothetical protein [Kiritimatiellia bacterium]
MTAEHLATIEPRLYPPELLNRQTSLTEIRNSTFPTARKDTFHHGD